MPRLSILFLGLLGLGSQLSAAQLVGKLPGDVTVTNTGSAVYTMPISMPPGIAGMAPELGIAYDSSSGNGLLGMGFSLYGLSAITRTPTTLEQDEITDGIDFDMYDPQDPTAQGYDRFALDGQRLVCVSGDYGFAGSEYRTEIDSFARVTAVGSSNKGPDYFIVETKSGLKKTYGQTNSASLVYNKFLHPDYGTKVTWLLNKIEDTNGNVINYNYASSIYSEMKYISEISYGSPGHLLKAVMEYGSRDDDIPSYLHGVDFKTTRRLEMIRIYSGSTELYNYTLTYDTSPQRPFSRLREIKYTDVATGDWMETDLEWLDGSSVTSFASMSNWLGFNPSSSDAARPRHISGDDTYRDLIDMNGDGLLDRVEYTNAQTGASGMWVRLNTGNGFGTAERWFTSSESSQWRIDWNLGVSMLRDINGDGLPDKLDHVNGSANYGLWVSLNTGTGFDTGNKSNWLGFNPGDDAAKPRHVDNNGDTLRDLIDMNGDGLLDRVEYVEGPIFGVNYLNVRLNQGDEFGLPFPWFISSEEEQCYVEWDDGKSMLMDINGDGLPDKLDHCIHVLGVPVYGLYVSLNNGNGFDSPDNWLGFTPVWEDAARPRHVDGDDVFRDLIDMNGDGLPDRVEQFNSKTGEEDGIWVRLNTGEGFASGKKWYNSPEEDQERIVWNDGLSMLKDVNGDGLPDKLDHRDYHYGQGYGLYVAINTGDGFDAGISSRMNWLGYVPIYDEAAYPRHVSGNDTLRDLIDMNGDGLLDRVEYKNSETGANGMWVRLNTGTSFGSATRWFNSSDSSQSQIEWNLGVSMIRDVNGDGFPDKLDHDKDSGWFFNGRGVWVSANQCEPTLLRKITDNLGTNTYVEYAPLTDSSLYIKGINDATPSDITIQNPMRVVSKVWKDTGIYDDNLVLPDDRIYYYTEYTYGEARVHTRGRGFLGFRTFESYDSQTQLSKVETLRQDFPYTGMKLSSATYGPNGQLLSRSVNELAVKALNGGLTLFPYFKTSEEWKAEYDPNYALPAIDPVEFPEQYEAALIADLETNAYGNTLTKNTMADGVTGAFDDHGNLLRVEIDYGDGYTQTTVNTYANDTESVWFLGRLSDATVTSTAPDTVTGFDETVIRTSSFTYDSNGLLWTETVEPGEALAVTTTYTRDAQGRITSTTVDPADGTAITTETHSNLDSTGRFYTRTENVLGHAETRVYDPAWGRVTSQTGPNGRTTSFTYDALGRVTREDRPDGTWSASTYSFDNSQITDNPQAQTNTRSKSKYTITATGTEAPVAVAYYDRLGREIHKKSESYDGTYVCQDTVYNEIGQVECVSENYWEGGAPSLWTKTTYDDIGRPDVATAPDDTQVKTIYEGRTTTVIRNYQGTDTVNPNANDQTTVTLLNAKGDKQTVTSYNQAQQALTIDYHYDGVGNLLETVTTSPNDGTRTITMRYDIRGNKTYMLDPDMGEWSYTYNALGQLVTQTDAVGNVTRKLYDDLGRITDEYYGWVSDTNYETKHEFYYDGTGDFQQIGKLHLEKTLDSAQQETFRRSHYYDDLGRSFLTLTKTGGRWLYQQTDYDDYSRPVRLTHYWRPSEFADTNDGTYDDYLAWYSYSQETVYNPRSFVTEVKDANGQTWFSDPLYNEDGQLLSYIAGGSIHTGTLYDDATKLVEEITVDAIGGSQLLEQSFQFDSLGNFTQRTKQTGTGPVLTENFTYDRLNRLTQSSVTGGNTLSMTYDDFGNIKSRTSSDATNGLGHVAGNYNYTHGTNRVSSAGGRSFLYDDNGSITEIDTGGNKGVITWTAFNKPAELATNDSKRSLFGYDSANSRVLQTRQAKESGVWDDQTRKTYIGALFEQEQTNIDPVAGQTQWQIASTRIYISTPAGVVGSWVDDEAQTSPVKTIFHRDHLGSVVAQSDLAVSPATLTQEMSFDSWGLRRDATDWTGAPTSTVDTAATDRGYTGHEMLDELGLVHMNGRIYDPLLGRMLSADPHIQSPTNLQNYNRYSYVTNNPLSMTDPSGFFFKKLFKAIAKFFKKFWKTIVNAVLVVTGQWWALAIFTITMGAIQGGFRGALIAAATVAVTAAIGSGGGLDIFKDPLLALADAAKQGIVQGGFAELSGGDFGDGFLGGFTGSMIGASMRNTGVGSALGRVGLNNPVGRVVTAAVAGGTVSEIGGGKFENGAVSAAFAATIGEAGQAFQRATQEKGTWLYPEGGSTDINSYEENGMITVRTNGILGGSGEQGLKAAKQFATDTGTPFFWNPSGGFVADVWESFTQKIGFGAKDGLALGFYNGVSGANYPLNIIAHSQGTITVTNAQFQYGLAAGSRFELRSPAITLPRAGAAALSNGGTLIYDQPYGDGANLWAPSLDPVKLSSGLTDVFRGFSTHTNNGL